jgi:hypothetical protein
MSSPSKYQVRLFSLLWLVHPEGFAQEALGHNSKAVHRAYAKRAHMKLSSLEEYEDRDTEKLGQGA